VASNQGVTIKNDLTLNGTATLGDANVPSQYGYLYFNGAQTLGGTGTVVFGRVATAIRC